MKTQGNQLFWGILILLYFIFSFNKILFKRPQSVHNWAQCDRAAVALNYDQVSMDFFKPRVQEISNGSGITGLEFPLINFIAGIFFKIFGPSDFWYRALMLLIISAGLFYGFRFAHTITHDFRIALITIFLTYLSPVMIFYSPNFLPDTASLGFTLCAWYFFMQHSTLRKRRFIFLYFFTASLACLVKVTSLITPITITLVCLLDYLNYFKTSVILSGIFKKGGILLANLGCFILVYAWYSYASYLNNKYNSGIFLMGTNTVQSLAEAKPIWESLKFLYLKDYYDNFLLYIFLIEVIFLIIFFKRMDRFVGVIFLLIFFGTIGFVYFLFKQFAHHDYYIIPLLPLILFLHINCFILINQMVSKRKTVIAIYILLTGICIKEVLYCKQRNDDRYAPSYWANNNPYNDYFNLSEILNKNGVALQDKVISGYDESFNITLYLMNRRGIRITKDSDTDFVKKAFEFPVKYLVINDQAFFQKFPFTLDLIEKIPLFNYKRITCYRIKNR